MIYNGLPDENNSSLSPILSLPALPAGVDLAQVAQALTAAAAALAAAARALAPASSVAPVSPLSLSLPTAPVFSPVEITSVVEAVNLFLRAKARAGRSDRYLRQLRVSLNSFSLGRKTAPIAQVTVGELEKWIEKGDWAGKTAQNYLKDVRTLFNFLKRRGLVAANPAAGVEMPEAAEAPHSLHTPAQVAAVLEFARGRDLCVMRALAIRYFAGLRTAEAARLFEREIMADHIEVTAAKAKTRRRRPVDLDHNLAAWLKLGGELPMHSVSNRMRYFTAALLKEKNIPWPHNVTRHSFISYHLARGQSAARTALQAGTSEQLVFSNYRELVTKEAAAAYFAVFPQ